MAIRFRKSVKIAPGVRLNIGKKSASVRVGGKNIGGTVGTGGRSISGSLPGTGLGLSSQKRGGCAGAAIVLIFVGVTTAVALLLPPPFGGVY